MAHSRLQLGVLVPVKDATAADLATQTIALYEGFNTIGRSDLPLSSTQVSRKHISIHATSDGSFQIIVEGQNPVVVGMGTERRVLTSQSKAVLHVGDTIELLPGKHAFKLTGVSYKTSDAGRSAEGERLLVKRKRQEMEDEALARALQASEGGIAWDACNGSPEFKEDIDGNSERGIPRKLGVEANRNSDFGAWSKGYDARAFQLLRVQGLPNWANAGCLSVRDVIKGDVLFAMLSDYMVDLEWLLSACPLLKRVPRVVVIHGESGGSLERLKAGKLPGWSLHKPPLPLSYGTHHSKFMLLIYPTGVRVIVHTANMIYVDWNNKTQGLWMQDFPYKSEADKRGASSFEDDLVEYLEALQWSGCTMNLPCHGNIQINAAFFRRFDYRSAQVRLVASVPGYHQGNRLKKWGHMKLCSILEKEHFEKEFVGSSLVYQFSSLGSLDEKWLAELNSSMSAGFTSPSTPLGLGTFQIIWPTVEDVRCSIEGYAAGNAIPSPLKNVEKEFLRKYWARWQADHMGRNRAMPHIKSFVRYHEQNIAWFLLTSANLSKAAWGALQKNGSQLMIRSYELGVLFLQSLERIGSDFSCTGDKPHEAIGKLPNSSEYTEGFENHSKGQKIKFVTACWEGKNANEDNVAIVRLPIPYKLPPQSYGSEDIPWSWDRQYFHPDTYGELWPRAVQLYGMKDS